MFKKLGWIVLTLMLLGCASLAPKQESSYNLPASVVSWADTNAYQVRTSSGAGSGFWINSHYFITACHVVANAGEEGVIVQNNDRTIVVPVVVENCDVERDLALLSYFENDVVAIGAVETCIAAKNSPYGTGIWGAGYPLGRPLHITQGHVTSTSNFDVVWQQISAPTIFGDSGSAAVTLIDGVVVVQGVRVRVAAVPQGWFASFLPHLAIQVDAKTINEWLEELR